MSLLELFKNIKLRTNTGRQSLCAAPQLTTKGSCEATKGTCIPAHRRAGGDTDTFPGLSFCLSSPLWLPQHELGHLCLYILVLQCACGQQDCDGSDCSAFRAAPVVCAVPAAQVHRLSVGLSVFPSVKLSAGKISQTGVGRFKSRIFCVFRRWWVL